MSSIPAANRGRDLLINAATVPLDPHGGPGNAGCRIRPSWRRAQQPPRGRGPESPRVRAGRSSAQIRVSVVRPGVIRTPTWDQIPGPQREALFTTLEKRMLTNAIGEPDDIAEIHPFLMENRFVTGTVLTVDGGFVVTGS